MQGDSRGGIHTYLADRKFKEICRWQLNVSEPGLSRLCQVTEVGVPLTSLVTPTVSAGLKWVLVSYLSVCYDPIESFFRSGVGMVVPRGQIRPLTKGGQHRSLPLIPTPRQSSPDVPGPEKREAR